MCNNKTITSLGESFSSQLHTTNTKYPSCCVLFWGPILCSRSTVSQECGVERNISVGIYLLIYTANKSVFGDNKSLPSLTKIFTFAIATVRKAGKKWEGEEAERKGNDTDGEERGEWDTQRVGRGKGERPKDLRWDNQHNDNKRANNSRDNIFPRRSMSLMFDECDVYIYNLYTNRLQTTATNSHSHSFII